MKQISIKTMETLALNGVTKGAIGREEEFFASQWLKENAMRVAAIEMKRADKTYLGEFPKGWRSAMKAASKAAARDYIISTFKSENIKELDGALWLNNWQIIAELAS